MNNDFSLAAFARLLKKPQKCHGCPPQTPAFFPVRPVKTKAPAVLSPAERPHGGQPGKAAGGGVR
jgi:hypothetical protein